VRRSSLSLVAGLAGLGAAGCFNPFSPTVLTERVTTVAPSPTTPQNAVRLFEWCWKNRGVEEYKELFTADYVFVSAGLDSAGNPSREIQARRDDEVQIAENMFIGSAERPPAADIQLDFDRNLIPFPDTRPGKDPTWHKTIRTSVNLKVKIDEGNVFEVTGTALFYLVRGDSALIPAELIARGFKPDPLRWWIDRWEDETLAPESVVAGDGRAAPPAAGVAVGPETDGALTTAVSMAELKRWFLQSPALRARLAALATRPAAGSPGALR
jgi:hypothetical protein